MSAFIWAGVTKIDISYFQSLIKQGVDSDKDSLVSKTRFDRAG